MKLRIAPSPTGSLHIGNARTALFNWLYAKANGGTFVVRIDDTDIERSTEVFQKDILENLRWLGLDWDEGVEVGGEHGDYKQSSRFERYREVANELLEKDLAYKDDGAIRFKVPSDRTIEFKDFVRGDMSFETSDVEDFVILRSDNTPTYHLASTVDDRLWNNNNCKGRGYTFFNSQTHIDYGSLRCSNTKFLSPTFIIWSGR